MNHDVNDNQGEAVMPNVGIHTVFEHDAWKKTMFTLPAAARLAQHLTCQQAHISLLILTVAASQASAHLR